MRFTNHWIFFLGLVMTVETAVSLAATAGITKVVSGKEEFLIRPYSFDKDQANLQEMCKDVYGGQDHLPSKAKIYEKDPDCELLVMEDVNTGNLVAAGNLQTMDPPRGESIWIEAIRVSPHYEGRGIGTLWMRELLKRIQSKGAREALSCTIDANEAMKKVFSKAGVGMVPVNGFRNPDWKILSQLPGWSRSDVATTPQNLLQAMDLEDKVSETARNAGVWEPIETYEELQEILKLSTPKGTIGHLPTFAGLQSLTDDLRDSLEKGLVRKLRRKTTDNEEDPSPPPVFALVQSRLIDFELKNQYLCSIVATNRQDFDAALWEACQPHYVPLLGGIPSFLCIFERPHPPIPFEPGSIQEALPIRTHTVFILYRRVFDESDAL